MIPVPSMSIAELTKTAEELVTNALILEPQLPPPIMAERIISMAEPVFAVELGRSLMIDYFSRLIRSERAKRATIQQPRLPGCEHLPLRITGKRDRRVALSMATFSDIRQYCWALGRKHLDRKRVDPKLVEAKALMIRMRKPSKKNPGITVGEVLGSA